MCLFDFLFNNMPTLVGHFVSFSREGEKQGQKSKQREGKQEVEADEGKNRMTSQKQKKYLHVALPSCCN